MMVTKEVAIREQGTAPTLTREQVDLIKRTVAVGASDTELQLFLYQANKRGLDPLARQIHFIKRKKYNPETERYEEVGTIQTGIDGFRVIADRTGKLAGISRGVIRDAKGDLAGAWAEIYRSDWTHPAREEVSFKEYCQNKKDGSPMGLWATMPETMIKKVAEVAALRMAFPEDLSGIYSHDEMQQADIEPTPQLKQPPKKQPQTRSENAEKPPDATVNGTAPITELDKPEEMVEGMALTWESIRPALAKLFNGKVEGWATTDSILKKLRELGAVLTIQKIEDSFNSLSPEGKAEFKNLVEKALPSK